MRGLRNEAPSPSLTPSRADIPPPSAGPWRRRGRESRAEARCAAGAKRRAVALSYPCLAWSHTRSHPSGSGPARLRRYAGPPPPLSPLTSGNSTAARRRLVAAQRNTCTHNGKGGTGSRGVLGAGGVGRQPRRLHSPAPRPGAGEGRSGSTVLYRLYPINAFPSNTAIGVQKHLLGSGGENCRLGVALLRCGGPTVLRVTPPRGTLGNGRVSNYRVPTARPLGLP